VADDSEEVTALVLLRPASGREITGEVPITAETLHEFAPDPDDAAAAASALAEAGFEPGSMLGISLPVTGPRRLFEDYFGVRVQPAEEGGWIAVDASGTASRELPVSELPDPVASRVAAATFEPPAELAGGDVLVP
jgi:hypothetical protein